MAKRFDIPANNALMVWPASLPAPLPLGEALDNLSAGLEEDIAALEAAVALRATIATVNAMQAATRVILAATVNTSNTVYLTEASREGEFYWTSSSMAAQVALDPAQCVYVPGTTAAGGCWIRKCDHITPQMAGAVGNGVTDDSTAIYNSLQTAIDLEMAWRPPAGKYLMDSQAAVTVSTGNGHNYCSIIGAGGYATQFIPGTANSSGCIHITLATNKCRAFVKDVGFFSQLNLTDARMSAFTHNGKALWIEAANEPSDAGWGSVEARQAVVSGVVVTGTGNDVSAMSRNGMWSHGIKIDYCWYALVKDCQVKGLVQSQAEPIGPAITITAVTNADLCAVTAAAHGYATGNRVYISGIVGMIELNGKWFTVTVVDANNFTLDGINSNSYGTYISGGTSELATGNFYRPESITQGVWEAGIELINCFHSVAHNNMVSGYHDYNYRNKGTQLSGNSEQGGIVEGGFYYGGRISVEVNHSNTTQPGPQHPGFQINNTHVNGGDHGIHIKYRCQVMIANVYGHPGNPEDRVSAGTLTPSLIWIDGCSDVLITNCGSYNGGFYNSDTNASVGIWVGNEPLSVPARESYRAIHISNCQLDNGGIGILNDNPRAVYAIGCTFDGTKTGYTHTPKPVVDNTGSLTVISASVDNTPGEYRHTSYLTNAAVSPRMKWVSARNDYASNTTPDLGSHDFTAFNSAGTELTAAQFYASWLDNTAASEKSQFTWRVYSAGALASMILNGNLNRLLLPSGFYLGMGGTTGIYSGSGSPETVVTAGRGSIYLNTAGGAGTTLYVKESGVNTNTGWIAK